MTNQKKWNFIVQEYQKLYNEREEAVDSRWRKYCAELFGYSDLFGEIKTQTSIHVGVHDHAIPDIILCKDGKDILDIELKQYSFGFDNRFEEQLISYLKLTHLSVGMIVCKEIYLYAYDYANNDAKKLCIPFVADNADGVALMELLQRDTFSAEAIRQFVQSYLDKVAHVQEIQQQVTDDLAFALLKAHFAEKYTAEEIEEALSEYTVTARKKAGIPAQTSISTPPMKQPTPDTSNVVFSHADMATLLKQWCSKKHAEGVLYFDVTRVNNSYCRFTTKGMDTIIPTPVSGKSGWNNNHFYYYEVVNKNNFFYIWLACSHENAPAEVMNAFAKVFDFCHVSLKEKWDWQCLFKTKYIYYNQITSPNKVDEYLDALLATVMRDEANLIKAIGN